ADDDVIPVHCFSGSLPRRLLLQAAATPRPVMPVGSWCHRPNFLELSIQASPPSPRYWSPPHPSPARLQNHVFDAVHILMAAGKMLSSTPACARSPDRYCARPPS